MKAVVLAGGKGQRLGKLTSNTNKCLLQINKKTLIEYNLDLAISAGAEELIVVLGYRGGQIVEVLGKEYSGTKVRYVIQQEPRGLVHALSCAEETVDKDDFLLILGDEYYLSPRHHLIKSELEKIGRPAALCGYVFQNSSEEIRKTYLFHLGKEGWISRFIEKPKYVGSYFQGTGTCFFTNQIFGYVPETPVNPVRGEKELPGLLQCAADDGYIIYPFRICDTYYNINTWEDLISLETQGGDFDKNSNLE